MTYTRILIIVVWELGGIAASAAAVYVLSGYEANVEHAESVERAHLPAYLTESER